MIVNGYKDVENRSRRTNFRGRIYVHAGVSLSEIKKKTAVYIMRRLSGRQADHFMIVYHQLTLMAIIGEVDIVDCCWEHTYESSWAENHMWQWKLSNPIAYDKPIPYKGRLGFFEVEMPL